MITWTAFSWNLLKTSTHPTSYYHRKYRHAISFFCKHCYSIERAGKLSNCIDLHNHHEIYRWWKLSFPSWLQQRHLVLNFQRSEEFVTALLPGVNHPAHINVVVGKGLPELLHSGVRQSPCATQDPGEVHVEESQDVRTGIHQGRVHIVGGQDPVWGVGQY